MNSKILVVVFFLICCSCQSGNGHHAEELAIGREVYIANCISCHQDDGTGVQGVYPSLVRSTGIAAGQTNRTIKLIKHGSGLEGGMQPVHLTGKEIAQVINYIQNSWGNQAPMLTAAQVEAIN